MKLGLRSGRVELVDHDPQWEVIAAQTIEQLWRIFNSTAKDIQQIGSSAIKGIKAKPMIDIAVAVRSFNDLKDIFLRLEEIGVYKSTQQPLPGIILCAVKKDRNSDTLMNIHIVEAGSVQWQNHIIFRDYLIDFPQKAITYEKLKINLAAQYPDNRDAYSKGKKVFIEECLYEARSHPEMRQNM